MQCTQSVTLLLVPPSMVNFILNALFRSTFIPSVLAVQGVYIGLKLSGQVAWTWLLVLSPILTLIFLLGVGALWLVLMLLINKK